MSAVPESDSQQELENTLALLRSKGGDQKTIAYLESLRNLNSAPPARQTELPALLAAATHASFTVAELRDAVASSAGGEPSSDDLSVVLKDCLAVAGLSPLAPQRYVLFDSVRQNVLMEGKDSPALAAFAEAAVRSKDLETHFLARLLRNPLTIEIEKLDEVEMLAAAKAAGMVSRVRPEVEPLLREMRRRLDLEEIIRALRVLIGRKSPVGEGLGPDVFVGREKDLRALYTHVGIRPPETIVEQAGRLLKSAMEAFTGAPTGALVVHGIGGMGKSALMARFVLEHVRRDEHWLPFAYLDFDRSTLAGAGPAALFIEIVRQVGLEVDPLRAGAADAVEALPRLRAEMRTDLSKGATEINEEHVWRFRSIVDRFAGDRPFLLVLDTVERLQLQGATAVRRLQDLLSAVGLFDGAWQRLRVVACSRMDVPELRDFAPTPSPVELGAMESPEARLLASGILRDLMPGRAVAEELVNAIGEASKGYPLFIRVLATHVAHANLHDDQDLIRDLQSTKGRAARVATVFYTRFADRIVLPGGAKTFKVATCLRTITPARLDIALRGLDLNLTSGDISEAFRLLHDDGTLWAEKSLTFLRWRPELRALMLGCIRDESDGASGTLQRVAGVVADASATPGASDAAAADAAYYTLLAGRGVPAADLFWRSEEEFRSALVDAAQDFPVDSVEATYLRLAAARRRPNDQQLAVLPPFVGWQLAWDAEPELANPGGGAVDRGVLRLVDLAPRIERVDLDFKAQRFALLAKTGRWREARRLLSDKIVEAPVDRASLLHWCVRADRKQMREQVPRIVQRLARDLQSNVADKESARARTRAIAEAAETMIGALVAARVAEADEIFTTLDRTMADIPVGRLPTSNLSTTVLLAGSFGNAASEWAVEAAFQSKILNAVSSSQVAMLMDVCRSLGSELASRLAKSIATADLASAPARSFTDGGVLAAVSSVLRALPKEWPDETARRAFFRAFFGQRNPEWIEPFAYVLASIFETQPRREGVLLDSVQSLGTAGIIDSQLVSRARRRSHHGDATDLLRMMDEAGALATYLAALNEHFTADESIVSRSISTVLSAFGQTDNPAQERIVDFSRLVDRFEAWVGLKEQYRPSEPRAAL